MRETFFFKYLNAEVNENIINEKRVFSGTFLTSNSYKSVKNTYKMIFINFYNTSNIIIYNVKYKYMIHYVMHDI